MKEYSTPDEFNVTSQHDEQKIIKLSNDTRRIIKENMGEAI